MAWGGSKILWAKIDRQRACSHRNQDGSEVVEVRRPGLAIQRVMCIISLVANDLLQFGHFLLRDLLRSSMHVIHRTWPQLLITVSLKFTRQTLQTARACFITCFVSIWDYDESGKGPGAALTRSDSASKL